jgi:hypothetical protein
MNLVSGVFTAPVKGRYQFTFNALSSKNDNDKNIVAQMRVNNDDRIGNLYSSASDILLSISGVVVSLEKGDKVYVWLVNGKLYDSNLENKFGRYTHFSGILLEEDLVL